MFLVWGHKYDLEPLRDVPTECPQCKQERMELCRGRKRFTLYWIKTFTMAEGYFLRCKQCSNDALYEVEPQVAEELIVGER